MMANDIEARLRRVEDQLAIYQVIAAHPCAVDGGNIEALGELYADDGVYAIGEAGDAGRFAGRPAVQALIGSPAIGDMVAAGMGHIGTLPYVVIDGDRAVATGHAMVVLRDGDGFRISRLSAARYELERQANGEWQIILRKLHLLDGNATAPAMLGRLMDAPEPVPA
jgi:ketosteroid isomerase-like protein